MLGVKIADAGPRLSIDGFLWPNKYMLNFLGFWPLDPDASIQCRYFTNLRLVISVISVLFLFVPEILKIIVFWSDIDVLFGVSCVAMTVGQSMFKMLYMIVNRHTFYKIYQTAVTLWSSVIGSQEAVGLESLALIAKRWSIVFFCSSSSNIIIFTNTSILLWINYNAHENKSCVERKLPFDAWFGFNTEQTPYFEITFGCQLIFVFYTVVAVVGIDCTMMTLILHVCGHFRTIHVRLQLIGREMLEVAKAQKFLDSQKKFRDAVIQCIQHHRFMIKFAEDLRKLLSPMVLVQLLTSGLEFCLAGYAIVVNRDNGKETIQFSVYFICLFVQLINWCWPGQILINDSNAMRNVVYCDIPWYLFESSERRELCFILIRTHKKSCITAFNFQVMSFKKLTEVFHTAGSYVALLRKVYEKKEYE